MKKIGQNISIEKMNKVKILKYDGEIKTKYIQKKIGGNIMIFIAILIGCILGALIGMNAPMISYTYSSYLAIAIIAALDSVFGGITSVIKKNFDLKIFVTGFFEMPF